MTQIVLSSCIEGGKHYKVGNDTTGTYGEHEIDRVVIDREVIGKLSNDDLAKLLYVSTGNQVEKIMRKYSLN